MAQTTTTLVIKSKTSDFEKGLNDSKSSFQQWTQSIDSLTGGFASKLTNALANPWTAVAGGVALATKSLKDLTEAGMVGQDRLLKFSAMLGSKSEANSLVGAISELSDTSFESRDAIEAFAEKLIGAGHSADEVKDILSATIDISNTSGRGFEQVGNAIEQAFNGSSTEIERMVPSLKGMGDEAWQSGEAIKHIADELHDASVTIASGSLSNQLGAIGNSWEQIKENLGTSIVTQIQATGALDTIANWLEKIEKNTQEAVRKQLVEKAYGELKEGKDLSSYGRDIALEAYNRLSSEIWQSYQQSSSSNLAMPYTLSQSDAQFNAFWQSLTAGQRQTYTQWSTDATSLANWEKAFLPTLSEEQQKLYSAVQGKLHGLATDDTWVKAQAFNKEMDAYWKLVPPLMDSVEEGVDTVAEVTTTVSEKKTDLQKWQENYTSFLTSKNTYWSEGALQTDLSWKERIEARDWGSTTDADWDKYLTMILSCPDDTKRQNLLKGYSDDRTAYETWKNAPTSSPSLVLGIGKNPWGEGSKPYEAMSVGTRTYDWMLGGFVSEQSRKTAEILLSEAPDWDSITEEDWAELAETISMFPEGAVRTQAEEIYRRKRNVYETYLWLQKNPYHSTTPTTIPSVELNWGYEPSTEVPLNWGVEVPRVVTDEQRATYSPMRVGNEFYSWERGEFTEVPSELNEFLQGYIDGEYTEREANYIAESFGYTMDDLGSEIKKIEDENTLKTINNLQQIVSAIGSLSSALKGWGDEEYQTGEIGAGISAIGSVVGMIPGAQAWGAGIALAGMGISLVEQWASDDEGTTSYTETEMDESYKGVVHQYQGGLELHIHNDFEGANIVGESGMGELARTIQRQIELYAYDNNL